MGTRTQDFSAIYEFVTDKGVTPKREQSIHLR